MSWNCKGDFRSMTYIGKHLGKYFRNFQSGSIDRDKATLDPAPHPFQKPANSLYKIYNYA